MKRSILVGLGLAIASSAVAQYGTLRDIAFVGSAAASPVSPVYVPEFVNYTNAYAGSSVATLSMSLSNWAGNFIAIGILPRESGLQTGFTVADTGGNTYTRWQINTNGSDRRYSFWYATNTASVGGNSNYITVTASDARSSWNVNAIQFTNVALYSALDQSNSQVGQQSGAGDDSGSGSITPGVAKCLILGYHDFDGAGSYSVGTNGPANCPDWSYIYEGSSPYQKYMVQTNSSAVAIQSFATNIAGTPYFIGAVGSFKPKQ